MIKNKRVWVSIALACVMMLGVVGCGSKSQPVATIDGEPLLEENYRAYLFSVKMQMEQGFGPEIWEIEMEGESMEDVAKERALESAVAMFVTSKKAKEMDIKLTSEEKEEAKKIAADYVEQLKEPLAQEGISEGVMKNMMEEILISQKVLDALSEQFVPSEDQEEFEKFVEENKTYFEEVTAQHVLINTVNEAGEPLPEDQLKEAKETADKVLASALAGEDMGKLAKEYSQDPGSKDKNGEYTFPRGQMVPEFEEAAFNGEEGKVHPELVETVYGYHIVKTLKKASADEEKMKKAFEENQKAEYVNSEIDEWITGAKVEKTDLYDTIVIKKPEAAETKEEAEKTGETEEAEQDQEAEEAEDNKE